MKERHVTISGQNASTLTDVLFGAKWLGGTNGRVLEIAHGSKNSAIAARSAQSAERADVPSEFRRALRKLQNVYINNFRDATYALTAYLDVAEFGYAWEDIRAIIRPNGDPIRQQRLLRFIYDDVDYSAVPWADRQKKAKETLCDLAGISEEDFNNTRERTHLPLAVIEYFGIGGLMFLPKAKDAARSLWNHRSALRAIFRLVYESGQGAQREWLKMAAEEMRVEIVEPVLNREAVEWRQEVLRELPPKPTLLAVMAKLRSARIVSNEPFGSWDIKTAGEAGELSQWGCAISRRPVARHGFFGAGG